MDVFTTFQTLDVELTLESALAIMDSFRAIDKVETHTLTSSDRREALRVCREFMLKAEASEMLTDALDALQPNFKQFGWTPIERLGTLLKFLDDSKNGQDRLVELRNLDTVAVIVCGLSLGIKKITRMKAEVWDEILRQAEIAAGQLRPILLHSKQVADTVRGSSLGQSEATTSLLLLVLFS